MDREPSAGEIVEAIGVEAAAERYVEYLAGRYEYDDLIDAIWAGDFAESRRLPVDVAWQILLTLIRRWADDDEMLWRLGDGPVQQSSIDPEIQRRLFESRETDPSVARLFEAMRRMQPIKWGETSGFWFD